MTADSYNNDPYSKKDPFTVIYRCDACGHAGVKLWRGVHGAPNQLGHKLLCASCLSPSEKVSRLGHVINQFGDPTNQVGGWVPALPSNDTFWGHTSAPPIEWHWWRRLPTYPFLNDADTIIHLKEVLDQTVRDCIALRERLDRDQKTLDVLLAGRLR